MRYVYETPEGDGPRLFTLSEQEPVALFAIGERHGRSVHPVGGMLTEGVTLQSPQNSILPTPV
jgi:hypothetical protein